MNFCSNCGARVALRIPSQDDRARYVCDDCQSIHYQNPKIVVGTIPAWNGKILLCQRAIQPRYGKWTLPAGFLENGETVAQGARRETEEEARAQVDIVQPYLLFNLTFVNQVYLMFRAKLLKPDYAAGQESLNVRLFAEQEIPWDDLAFWVIHETLQHYFKDLAKGQFNFYMGDITRRRPNGDAEASNRRWPGAT